MKQQLTERIKELDAQITALSDELMKAKKQLAELSTEFKPGDRVTYDGAGKVWEVREIRPATFGVGIRLYGSVIKKDGTPGAVKSEIFVPYKKCLVQAVDAGNERSTEGGPLD